MYRLVRQEYIDMMNSNRGVLAARIVIGETVIEAEQIYSLTCESAACPEKLSVGNFVMPKLTASISKEVSLPLVTSGLKVAFYVGMSADGTDFEYALVCSAQVASVTQKGQLYEISAHSSISNRINQLYNSELTFPQSSHSVLQEIGNYIGVKIDCNGVSEFSIDTQPSGYSCREIIASIAEKSGVNVFVSRDDSSIIFKWFEDTETELNSDCINEPSLSVEPVCYKGVTCTSGGELLVSGEEPFLTLDNINGFIKREEDLALILSRISSVSFRSGSISMLLGNILYDPWDIVTIAVDGNTVMLPICNLSHKYDGGLTTEIRIPEQEKVSSDGSSSLKTTAERAVDRLTAELFSAKEIMADKASVNELSANLAEFENATANSLQAQQAQISSLEAEKLNADELSAKVANLGYATVDSLKAESARIDELDATKLEASSAEIKNLEAGVADINTLIFGSASGDVIQTEFANAVVAQLGDAQIKSAMIESVSAGKITAGDIVTNNVRVVSEDGSLLIEDETMQISDGNTMRVQIGKDALGDYSLYVWDKDGKLMFDALGVHEAGIKSGIIRDDMVSDTANISAGKLNIDSLFTVINEDGSNTLKASKILLDENNQTLEVAFKSMNSKVTEVDNEVSSMGTQLQVVQGQMSAKVWEQDITKAVDDVREDFESEVETLSSSYSELNQTVGNIGATVAKHTSDINSASSRVAELELSVDSFKSEVSSTYTTKEELDNLEIGGRNLLLKSGVPLTTSSYLMCRYYFGDERPVEGEIYTITIKGTLGSDRTDFRVYNSGGNVMFGILKDVGNGLYSYTGAWKVSTSSVTANNTHIIAYHRPNSAVSESTIEWIKLEKGNKRTDWTPAPEDNDLNKLEISGRNLIRYADKLKGEGWTKSSLISLETMSDGVTKAIFNRSGLTADSELLMTYYCGSKTNRTVFVGDKLTASAYYYQPSSQALPDAYIGMQVRFYDVNGTAVGTPVTNYIYPDNIVSDKWVRITCNIESTAESYYYIRVILLTRRNGYIEFAYPQLEKGTKPTAWKVAPEDMASADDLADLEVEMNSTITQTAESITLSVDKKLKNYSTTEQMNSAIEQSADKLRLSVEETTEAFDKRLASAEASIQVNADNITQKVSAEDYNGEKIASLINQSAKEVCIDAPHIKLEGVVTANEGFKIDTDGSMEATAGTIGGWKIRETDLYGESEVSPDGNKFYSITLSRTWNYNDAQPIIYVTHVEKHVETNPGGNTTVLDVERRVAISPSGDAYFYNISAKNLMRGTLEVVVSSNTTLVTANIPTSFTPSETTQCVASLRTVGSPSPRYINCWVNYFKPSETADPLLQVCMTCGGSSQTAVPAGTYYIDYIIADV